MKEIGGYLEFETYNLQEYHQGLLRLNTVRNAMQYVIQNKGYSKVYIPYYLCHSVSNMLEKINMPYEYYYINENLEPIFNHRLLDTEVIVIVNFYGQFDNGKILSLKNQYINVIIDNTHSFFQKPLEGVDTVYTCRKYFGVPDGAYLNSDIDYSKANELELDSSVDKMLHILGRYEESAGKYYSIFKENDEKLSNQEIKRMSKLTNNLLKGINYSEVIEKRKKNFDFLDRELKSINKMRIAQRAGLFMYPLLMDNGKQLKNKLIEQKIFVPTLWANVLENVEKHSWEYNLVENMVLLPIDQRYNEEDMSYIINQIMQFNRN